MSGNASRKYIVSDKGFMFSVPMNVRSEIPDALKLFTKDIGRAIIMRYSTTDISGYRGKYGMSMNPKQQNSIGN